MSRVRYIVDDVAAAVAFYVHHLDFHLIGTRASWTTLCRGSLHLDLTSPGHKEVDLAVFAAGRALDAIGHRWDGVDEERRVWRRPTPSWRARAPTWWRSRKQSNGP